MGPRDDCLLAKFLRRTWLLDGEIFKSVAVLFMMGCAKFVLMRSLGWVRLTMGCFFGGYLPLEDTIAQRRAEVNLLISNRECLAVSLDLGTCCRLLDLRQDSSICRQSEGTQG